MFVLLERLDYTTEMESLKHWQMSNSTTNSAWEEHRRTRVYDELELNQNPSMLVKDYVDINSSTNTQFKLNSVDEKKNLDFLSD